VLAHNIVRANSEADKSDVTIISWTHLKIASKPQISVILKSNKVESKQTPIQHLNVYEFIFYSMNFKCFSSRTMKKKFERYKI
jgi:hypothetical protein